MNTKGMKFLAVLAVLAMAFAAFAVMEQNDAAVPEKESGLVIGLSGETVTVAIGEDAALANFTDLTVGKDSDVTDKTVNVKITGSGTLAKIDGAVYYGTTYTAAEIGLNLAALDGLVAAEGYIGIEQTDSALANVYKNGTNGKPIAKNVDGTYTMQSYWVKGTLSDGGFGVLIPQDGSNITLNVYKAVVSEGKTIVADDTNGDGTTGSLKATGIAKLDKTWIATIVLDFSKFTTKVALGADAIAASAYLDTEAKWWSYAVSAGVGTLTLPSGDKFSNVEFTGAGIKAGTGVNDAMMLAAGFPVKLVQNSTTTYFSAFADALAAVAYDASITLLDDVKTDGVAYVKEKALSIDLNSKTLTLIPNNNKSGVIGEGLFEIGNAGKAVKIFNGKIAVKAVDGSQDLSMIENFNVDTEISNVTISAKNLVADAGTGWDTVIFNRNGTLTLSGETKIITDKAKYAIVSDSFKHTHNDVAYTGSLVKIASNDVVVDGNMLVTYSTTSTAWAADALTGKGFDISAGTFSGILARGAITEFENYTIGAYAVATYADDMTFALSGGTFSDYSALEYVVKGKTINIDAGGKDVPAEEAKAATITEGTAAIDTASLNANEANVFIMPSDAAITKLEADVSIKDVVIIGKGQNISGVDLKVSGEGSVALTGFGQINGTITTGTGTSAQTVKLINAQGTFTISQGSIIVDAEWLGGDIELSNDQVLKISGTVETATAHNIVMKEGQTKGAKVIIEAGAEKSLTIEAGATLTIGQTGDLKEKIAVEVEGKLTGAGTLTMTNAKSITVKDGGELSVTTVTEAKTNTVYSGGDINKAGIDITKWTGKDAASGSWKYADNTLTLTNYNGTYNFAKIPVTITDIELNGDSVISVKMPVVRADALFGGASLGKITTTGAGSLSINVDMSKIETGALAAGFTVIKGKDAGLEINGVGLAVSVTGSNNSWEADDVKVMKVIGIKVDGELELYDVPLAITVMENFESSKIYGIDAGAMKVTGNVVCVNAATAVKAAGITAKSTAIGIEGDMDLGANAITVSNVSLIEIDGLLTVGAITVSQESEIDIKDAKVGGDITNNGIINFEGKVSTAANVDNYAVMNNSGILGIFGAFTNTTPGVFTNEGTFNVYAKEKAADEAGLAITDAVAPTSDNVKLKSISLTEITQECDGTLSFEATITVYKSAGYEAVDDKFTGIITPAINGGYSLVMASETAMIDLTYDPDSTTGVIGAKKYNQSVTGSVKILGVSYYLVANTTTTGSEATIPTDTVDDSFGPSGANFTLVSGTMNNNGTVVVSAAAQDKIIESEAKYNGNLEIGRATATIDGEVKGDITATGNGTLTVKKVTGNITAKGDVVANDKMTGDITADGDVTVKELVGNIVSKGSVTITKMTGDVTVNRANADIDPKTVAVKDESNINLTYNSNYKDTKDATEATKYTSKMTIVGTPKDTGLVIDLARGADATSSTAVIPGCLRIVGTAALADEKTVNMTLTEGKLLVDSVTVLEKRYYLTIEAGATIEVNKSAASLDVKKAGLKVSKDAIANFETGAGVSVNYGKVLFVMSFTIDDGAYTIYSDVAYALLNCDEGAELTVGESATIDQSIAVKNGVNILVKDVTLTFDAKGVEMGDGAKITIDGTGKVKFTASGDNKPVDKDTEYVYYTVSGTIVYDDNVIEFDGVRFTGADSVISGVAATSSAASKISANLQYNEGIATVTSGFATGSIALESFEYKLLKADTEDTMVSGTFVVSEDAVFDAVAITDMFGKVNYKASGTDIAIDKIVRLPTMVDVDGILNLSNNTTVKGTWVGEGYVTLAAGKEFVLDASDLKEAGDGKTVPASTLITIIDTTDDMNGYELALVSADYNKNITIKATTYKIDGVSNDVMTIAGDLGIGAVSATTAAFLNGLVICKDSAVIGDEVYIIAASNAQGKLAAKEIFMKEEGVTAYAELTYDTTFTEGEYTVYTVLANVDLSEITDITVDGDRFVMPAGTMDLSGKDVTITVKEGTYLHITENMIVGTPTTTLAGASAIIGDLYIDNGKYVLVYTDVDVSDATFLSVDKKTPAVYSNFDIEGTLYAVVYAGKTTTAKLDAPAANMKPEISGYTFTSWSAYNNKALSECLIGSTDVTGGTVAEKVTITVQSVAGVTYYLDGVEYVKTDMANKVSIGQVFTMKISDTTKYEGTPVIDGKTNYVVSEDGKTIKATGVTEKKVTPEPEPEPQVDGISLTDILLIVLVVLIAILVVIIVLRLNRS